ncbi:MAG: stage 0 sporulation protein [Candidatus Tectomicrobia bacterium]|uniref:Stage 0 sporulation protein n=1 Tax=Tectimicrobiota bacterium TaxID=2528274 RepID=A0A932GNN4_UNCTE|nr:stage 0 sporulation protein [Candidatus Tectomicrobia bacterium]
MFRVVGMKFPFGSTIHDYKTDLPDLQRGDVCVLETENGQGVAEVALPPRKLFYILQHKPMLNVLRKATPEDMERDRRNTALQESIQRFCEQKIGERKTEMKLVRVEVALEGKKATVFFTAPGRIDFRDLVREVAQNFKIRIEMKQIGVRDEAKMFGGFGPCGLNLCCSSYLREFHPVSIRMAKDQDLPVNPSKISGVCGRLFCCLAYEHTTYVEMSKNMPHCGKTVCTKEGCGRVIKTHILQERVTVEMEDGKTVNARLDELMEVALNE